MAAWDVKTVGLDKLLKKLDVDNLVTPEKTRILKEAADDTKRSLGPTLPRRTGASAAKLEAHATPTAASVGVPRYPYVFLEAGSQFHEGSGPRAHRAKTAAQRRGGRYRIQPRRFLTKERTKVRRRLIDLIQRMKARVEKRWAA